MMDSYLYLAPLHSLEAVQRDAEQGWSEQENLNEEFSEEIANVVAALNNSFSNWKELQVVAQCSLLIAHVFDENIQQSKYWVQKKLFCRQTIQRLQTRQFRFLQHLNR